jgi:large subunit ribosomal protein L16
MVKRFAKYRKLRCGSVAGRGNLVSYGSIGLKVLTPGKITAQQIKAARMVITRTCSRKGKVVCRVNVFFPVSKKPLEVRMGGGKGGVDHHAARVRAGAVIFEIDNIDLEVAELALQKASYKLNIPCKVVKRKFANIE